MEFKFLTNQEKNMLFNKIDNIATRNIKVILIENNYKEELK